MQKRYNEPVFGQIFQNNDTKKQIKDFKKGLMILKEEFHKQYFNFYISRKTKMKYYSDENNNLIFTINKNDISPDKLELIERMQVLLTQSPRNHTIKAGDNTRRGHSVFNCIEFNSGIKSSANSMFSVFDKQFKSKELNTLRAKLDKVILKQFSFLSSFEPTTSSFQISEHTSLEHKNIYNLKNKTDKKMKVSRYGI